MTLLQKALVILLLLAPLHDLQAQETEARAAPSLAITTHPFNYIDPNKPAIRLGLEVKLNDIYWLDADVGYSPYEREGWRARLEVKHLLIGRSYLSAGAFHHNYRFTDQPTFFSSDEPELAVVPDPVDVHKLTTGFDGRIGYKYLLGPIIIDVYTGIGAMATTRIHDGADVYGLGEGFFGRRVSEGTTIYPKLSAGFRMGVWLKP